MHVTLRDCKRSLSRLDPLRSAGGRLAICCRAALLKGTKREGSSLGFKREGVSRYAGCTPPARTTGARRSREARMARELLLPFKREQRVTRESASPMRPPPRLAARSSQTSDTAPSSKFMWAGRFQRCCQTVCHGELSVSSFTTSRSQPRLTLTSGAAASERLGTSWRVNSER